MVLQLSPGVASSCFELLDILQRHRLSFGGVCASLGRIGVTTAERAMLCAQSFGWAVTNEEGLVILSASGERLMKLPTISLRLRQALLDYIDVEKPPWLQNASFGRQKVLKYSGTERGILQPWRLFHIYIV